MGLQAQWLIDSVQLNWKRWVVNFDQKRQRDFLSMLGLDKLPDSMLASIAILIATLLVSLFAIIIMRINRQREAPVVRLYNRFCMKLKKAGLERKSSEGPLDYLQRISRYRPDLSKAAEQVIKLYISIRYNERNSTLQLQQLAKSVRQFKVSKTT
jgi:hypothetical protein